MQNLVTSVLFKEKGNRVNKIIYITTIECQIPQDSCEVLMTFFQGKQNDFYHIVAEKNRITKMTPFL